MNAVAPTLPSVSQGYGCTDNPYEFYDTDCPYNRFHTGEDLTDFTRDCTGDPVYFTRDGTIVEIGSDNAQLTHDFGPYAVCYLTSDGHYIWYGHLSGNAVGLGQQVKAGQVCGWVGSLGVSTGPHLHYEVRTDGPTEGVVGSIDPTPWLNYAPPPPITGVDVMPSEAYLPPFKVTVPGTYDVLDNVNPNLVTAFGSARESGDGSAATGEFVFVRRSDGTPAKTLSVTVGNGDGVEMDLNDQTEVGSIVYEHFTGTVTLSAKVGTK